MVLSCFRTGLVAEVSGKSSQPIRSRELGGSLQCSSEQGLGRNPLRSTAVLHNFLKPAAQPAGLGLIGWHTLRRTFSTLLRGNGEDIKVQQELMRHADIRTTMNLYTRANSDQKRQAQGKIVQAVLAGESIDCSLVLPQPSGTR